MKNRYLPIAVSLLLALPGPAQETELAWHTDETDAKADARATNKPLLMFFSADWCDFCRSMEKETLQQSNVANHLKENFVLLKVDHDIEKDLVARYRIRGVPAVLIGDPELQKIEPTSGFMSADEFLTWLETALPKVSSEAIEADKKAALQFAVDISRSFREGLTEDQYAAINRFYKNFANKEPDAVKFAESHLTEEIKHNPGRFARFLKNEKLHVRILTSNAFAKLYGNQFDYDPWDLSKENYARLAGFLDKNNISSLLEDLIDFDEKLELKMPEK